MKIFGCFAAFIVAVSISAKVFAADEPDVHAYGAVAIELSTGRVLWEKEAHKQLPMASTTKIMTAILTLESCETSEIATVSSKAAAAPAVKLGLIKGEKISVRDLLHALMLQSSNDAAVVIAEHVGGSVENFCDLMTLKAKSIGAKDTSYKTPNGLDAEGHFSTAYDLAIITRYALENKDFRDLINTKTYTAKSDKRTFSLVNKNRFLYEYEGAFGVKTGYTGNAGNCFVGAAKKDGMEVITVVLGSGWGTAGKTRKFTDTKNIMNYSFKTYDMKNIINEGDYAGV
ncbi:MAG: D-alanyl-D-alanine carboxypeptidase, partial [Clostridiales bacterium]|nr:D-alanyl-D-alanine carboxypeptidase [Clostridiales bacterium]